MNSIPVVTAKFTPPSALRRCQKSSGKLETSGTGL